MKERPFCVKGIKMEDMQIDSHTPVSLSRIIYIYTHLVSVYRNLRTRGVVSSHNALIVSTTPTATTTCSNPVSCIVPPDSSPVSFSVSCSSVSPRSARSNSADTTTLDTAIPVSVIFGVVVAVIASIVNCSTSITTSTANNRIRLVGPPIVSRIPFWMGGYVAR